MVTETDSWPVLFNWVSHTNFWSWKSNNRVTVDTGEVYFNSQVQCKCKAAYFSFWKFLTIAVNPWQYLSHRSAADINQQSPFNHPCPRESLQMCVSSSWSTAWNSGSCGLFLILLVRLRQSPLQHNIIYPDKFFLCLRTYHSHFTFL